MARFSVRRRQGIGPNDSLYDGNVSVRERENVDILKIKRVSILN